MYKSISQCTICGEVKDRDQLLIYYFPEGPKLVCKTCYKQLPLSPRDKLPLPFDKKHPGDDIFPPLQ
ncbi:MAG: hypothetical protein ACFFDW_15390 [Candidatus Thorarchaeota archaeon]